MGQANYSASKAGIVAFSKSLAIEYAKKNININCVSPGFIKTEMTDKINEEFKNNLINKIPSGNLGTGQDVSNCVAFLASDMASYKMMVGEIQGLSYALDQLRTLLEKTDNDIDSAWVRS